jgi:hypothetical protein
MIRILLVLLALSITAALAQDATDPETDAAEEAPETVDEVAEDFPGIDDDLELYPVEDEDAFIPSENVAFGQSIPFPTDI